jgi:hemolysin III
MQHRGSSRPVQTTNRTLGTRRVKPPPGSGHLGPGPSDVVTPRWRGLLHQAAFFVAVPAGVALVSLAQGTSARVASIVYAISLIGVYGTSATYHRLARSERSRRWLKRLDHSMIFLLIAGTATPVALLGLQPPWSLVLMIVVWGGAAGGIVVKMFRIDRLQVLSGVLYITVGWAALLVAPQLVRGLSLGSLLLVGVGGVLYTCGAVVLLRRRPDPAPATFGYHEIWHAMVVVASACHYAAILLILLTARSAIG